MQLTFEQRALLRHNALYRKPSLEQLAKEWDMCPLELYDKVQALRDKLLNKRYYTKTQDLEPAKLKAPPGKAKLPCVILKEEQIKIERPPAVYSNHSPYNIAS